MMFYTGIDAALFHLGFQDAKYIGVPSSKESYEHFDQGGRVLYCIGQGPMRSPGHPSGNQSYLNQMLLRGEQHVYPVFKVYSNCVEYMGNYRILSFTKTMSFEGFMYFRYKLFREFISEPIVNSDN